MLCKSNSEVLNMAEQEKNTFIETEHEVLRFWEENDCFGKLREKNAGIFFSTFRRNVFSITRITK